MAQLYFRTTSSFTLIVSPDDGETVLVLSAEAAKTLKSLAAEGADGTFALLDALGADAGAYLDAVAAIDGIKGDLAGIHGTGGHAALAEHLATVGADRMPDGFADRLPGTGFEGMGQDGLQDFLGSGMPQSKDPGAVLGGKQGQLMDGPSFTSEGFIAYIGLGATSGAVTGATGGSVLPGVGTIYGGLFGAAVGGIIGGAMYTYEKTTEADAYIDENLPTSQNDTTDEQKEDPAEPEDNEPAVADNTGGDDSGSDGNDDTAGEDKAGEENAGEDQAETVIPANPDGEGSGLTREQYAEQLADDDDPQDLGHTTLPGSPDQEGGSYPEPDEGEIDTLDETTQPGSAEDAFKPTPKLDTADPLGLGHLTQPGTAEDAFDFVNFDDVPDDGLGGAEDVFLVDHEAAAAVSPAMGIAADGPWLEAEFEAGAVVDQADAFLF